MGVHKLLKPQQKGKEMSDTLILSELENSILTITLNRPDKLNSLNPELLEELASVLNSNSGNSKIRCVVLQGEGNKAFSAGFDISRIGEQGLFKDVALADPYCDAKGAIADFPQPVIAMIQGYCVGGGLEIAAACDMRIAAKDAMLGITPAKLGLAYAPNAIEMFVDLIGPAYTKELFFTGQLVTGVRAQSMGLINLAVPGSSLIEDTYMIAKTICKNAPISIFGIKRNVNKLMGSRQLTQEDHKELETIRIRAANSDDLQEGKRAFLEKRPPKFQGT